MHIKYALINNMKNNLRWNTWEEIKYRAEMLGLLLGMLGVVIVIISIALIPLGLIAITLVSIFKFLIFII